jgi:hypothetical protein
MPSALSVAVIFISFMVSTLPLSLSVQRLNFPLHNQNFGPVDWRHSFIAFSLEKCFDPTGFSNDEMRMNYSSSSYSLLRKKNEKTKLQSMAFAKRFVALGEKIRWVLRPTRWRKLNPAYSNAKSWEESKT